MITVTSKTSIEVNAPLCVKELAAALGVSAHFVYQMRACGFAMEWSAELRCQAASESSAREWIKTADFRIVNGRGRVKS